jgi:DNA-binding transcriptional ArsR family regulator
VKGREKEEVRNALQHELRRELLGRIDQAKEPLSANDLADILELRLSRVGYHLKVLADCGLVVPAGNRPRRSALDQSAYVIDPKVRQRHDQGDLGASASTKQPG